VGNKEVQEGVVEGTSEVLDLEGPVTSEEVGGVGLEREILNNEVPVGLGGEER